MQARPAAERRITFGVDSCNAGNRLTRSSLAWTSGTRVIDRGGLGSDLAFGRARFSSADNAARSRSRISDTNVAHVGCVQRPKDFRALMQGAEAYVVEDFEEGEAVLRVVPHAADRIHGGDDHPIQFAGYVLVSTRSVRTIVPAPCFLIRCSITAGLAVSIRQLSAAMVGANKKKSLRTTTQRS